MQSSHLSFGIAKINPAIPIAIRRHREEQCRQNASADASSIGKDNHHLQIATRAARDRRSDWAVYRRSSLCTVPLRLPFRLRSVPAPLGSWDDGPPDTESGPDNKGGSTHVNFDSTRDT